ncbi:MAG: bifunctional nicotinamidase/pyrazinamidase [Acidobacteria bacterium]|nr:bifunctional nicotinamidase/pyrazinamidase [Acidobacteriota bacterium]
MSELVLPTGIDPAMTALLVVDLQPDFMPGGALPVTGGDAIAAPIAELVLSRRFPVLVATQDWHPPDHISFAANHVGRQPFEVIELYDREQVLWPVHCVQGTPGAALHPTLITGPAAAIVRKGMDPAVDSYSAFRNNHGPDGSRPTTGLAGYLRDRGVTGVVVCGLARDYCVKWSAEDAAEAGFRVHVLWDLTRPVDPGSDEEVRAALASRGVHIVANL